MKTKNKILLFTLILPFIMVVVATLSIKKNLGDQTDIPQLHSEGIDAFKQSFDIDDFENISAEGFWNIDITHGDRFEVDLFAPEEMSSDISVVKAERTLVLSLREKTSSFSAFSKKLKINITLPEISEVNIKGVASILFSGFHNAETSISMDGVMNVTGRDCTFDRFSLGGSGVMNISMNVVPVVNAHFDYRGMYNATMLMNGGSLTGYLDGIGKMTVSGEISKNSILVKEFGQLKVIR